MAVKKIASISVIDPGSNPDVDSDFNTEVRDIALEHVTELYGKDNVANIITFNSLAAKSAFKAMCTIYQVPFARANKIAALVPGPIEGVECTISDIFDPSSDRYSEGAEFRAATSGSDWKYIIEGAKNIEGRYRSTGVHPCGIIMSSQPLQNVLPLQVRESDSRVITQWTYPECEAIGLIKFDFLGLDTVDLIQHTVEYIMKAGKTPPSMIDLIHGPMDDRKTYALLSKGETTGIFQLGSALVKDYLKVMKPEKFEDIAAATALLRPGPMGMLSHVRYANRKNGREDVESLHPDFKGSVLDDILAPTQGLIVFQEQILQISNQVAGMTLQEGDDLRSAMGKKKMKIMLAMRPKFFEGAKKKGYSEEAITVLWDTIELFAKYGFNKCLSGETRIQLSDGTRPKLKELHSRWNSGETLEALSMFEDGALRPHKIKNIVSTGKKPLYTVVTSTGKKIKVTKDHRLLTTEGYGTIEDSGLAVGKELIVDEEWGTRIGEKAIAARRKNMKRINEMMTPEWQAKSTAGVKKYQASLTFEERSARQKEIQRRHPQRTNPGLRAMFEVIERLHSDPEFKAEWEKSRAGKTTRTSWGRRTALSDGRLCDSMVEALAGNYLLSRGVEFELHKEIINGKGQLKFCDFYADGLYFEMDGLARGREYFVREKYGEDIPFVYMTPLNYRDVIDEALVKHHVKNGEEIVEIIPPSKNGGKYYLGSTFDIEMEDTGPANFVANGIVSHNSHSTAYAMNAYQAAWLKANYPVEFMAALISQNVGNKEKILMYLQEARRMRLKVGSVDINMSDVSVAPDYSGDSDFDIVYGFSGVNAVSREMAKTIVEEREANGNYTSLQDVVNRCLKLGVSNRKIYENLAKAGAFDSFGITRKAAVENLSIIIEEAKTKNTRGSSLFDVFASTEASNSEIDLFSIPEYPFVEKLQQEANVIGLYLTDHPLANAGTGLSQGGVISVNELMKNKNSATATVVGSITEIESKIRRGGGKSMTVTIDDGSSYITANLSRDIVKGLGKGDAQARVLSAYSEGAEDISSDTEDLATDPAHTAVPAIQKNAVYIMSITYRPPYGDGQYGARVNFIQPLQLSHGGVLPVRVRARASAKLSEDAFKERLMRFGAALEKKHPGDYPLFMAIVKDSDLLVPADDSSYYRDLASRVREEKEEVLVEAVESSSSNLFGAKKEAAKSNGNGKKKTRVLPEMKLPREAMRKATESELADKVTYFDTGFRVAKNSKLEVLLSDKFGGERVDFGIFNASMNDEGS